MKKTININGTEDIDDTLLFQNMIHLILIQLQIQFLDMQLGIDDKWQ